MDDADRAKVQEMRDLRAALQRTLDAGQETETPLVVAGQRCCVDCGAPIAPARLAARPQSVRCVDCKTTAEQDRKQR